MVGLHLIYINGRGHNLRHLPTHKEKQEEADKRQPAAVEQPEEAFQDGQEAKAIEAAKSFYANGVSVEIIAKALNMTQEHVLQIVKK